MNLPERHLKTYARIVTAMLLLAMPFSAFAVLGDTAASVLTDQARMKGTLRSTDHQTYVMHEITTTTGAVREFVTPAGAVFGVAWEGQFPPDFQQLLGPYYQQAQTAAVDAKQPRARRAPVVGRHARHSLPANWPREKLPWDGIHSATRAQRRTAQRYPLRRGSHEKNWTAVRDIRRAVDGGLWFQQQWRWRIIDNYVGKCQLLACDYFLRANQSMLRYGDGNRKLQLRRDLDGQRGDNFKFRLVHRAVWGRDHAAGHDNRDLDAGRQQGGISRSYRQSDAAGE